MPRYGLIWYNELIAERHKNSGAPCTTESRVGGTHESWTRIGCSVTGDLQIKQFPLIASLNMCTPFQLFVDELTYYATGLQKASGIFKPELVVYNAGTDILEGDPLGKLRVSISNNF